MVEPYCPDGRSQIELAKSRQSTGPSLFEGILSPSKQLADSADECDLSHFDKPMAKKTKRIKLSDDERKTRRAEAKRLKRAMVSHEQRAAEAERKRRQWASESEDAKAKRINQILSHRKTILSNESIAGKRVRLDNQSSYQTTKRSMETEAESRLRLDNQLRYQSDMRLNETAEERRLKLNKHVIYKLELFANETVQERETRLEKQRMYERDMREEQQMTRRAIEAHYQTRKITHENEQEKSERLANKILLNRQFFSNEAEAERASRLSKSAFSKAMAREDEDAETRAQQRERDSLAHAAIRVQQTPQQQSRNNQVRRVDQQQRLASTNTPRQEPPGEHYMRPMSDQCSHCGALYFASKTGLLNKTYFHSRFIFLTFTSNPKWTEITENLEPGQSATDRPDIVARVFRLKLMELKRDVVDRGLFVRVIAYIFTFEWQKRGLPHVHMLFTLDSADKPRTPDNVDRLIRAELPDVNESPDEQLFFDRVSSHMLHPDCGVGYPCWNGDACSKRFPKPFQSATDMDANSYPIYKRPNNGIRATVGTGQVAKTYGNQWVVPYSLFLLLKYNAHVNVEVCSVIQAVKYLYKYVYKGSDRSRLLLRQERRDLNGDIVDEVEEFLDARYLCLPEAFHRLFAFELHGKSNVVIDLAVHKENQQVVVFQQGNEQDAADRNRATTLIACFAFNKEARDLEVLGRIYELGPVGPRTIPYYKYPEHFTFVKSSGKWKRKAAHNNNIGRVHAVTPKQRERYCIRLLLHSTVGATTYAELFTVNDQPYPSAFEAAKELGLIHTNDHFDRAMRDADFFRMPAALRSVFCTLLAFDEPQNVPEVWEQWKTKMSEDYVNRGRSPPDAEALCYYDIIEMCLPLNIRFDQLLGINYARPAPMADRTVDHNAIGREMYRKLNPKTYCYQTLYHKLTGMGKKVMCTSWTGIASNLLPEGSRSEPADCLL